jgi:MoxR-like ATPase
MQSLVSVILDQVGSVVLGKPKEIRLALACLLAKGHILIEDLPGMGKTTLAQVLAKSLGLSYQRTQFTSDLLPADVIGISIFNPENRKFELHKGPIFNQVSIDGATYELPQPFFVIATQNPLMHAGTYPLPESQLDRFMMRISLGFPDVEAEKQILSNESSHVSYKKLSPCVDTNKLIAMQLAVSQITVSDNIIEYVIALSHVSRLKGFAGRPLSPRAGQALVSAAKAWAFIEERTFVIPEDIQTVFSSVCQHRLELTSIGFVDHDEKIADYVISQVNVLNPFGD